MSTVVVDRPSSCAASSSGTPAVRDSRESARVRRAISLESVRSMGMRMWLAWALSPSHLRLTSMRWYPKLVFTGSVTLPTGAAKTAESKGGVMRPFGKVPREPPWRADALSADSRLATSAKSVPSRIS